MHWQKISSLDRHDALLSEVLGKLSPAFMEQGHRLLREGQSCDSVPLVIEGSLRVFKTSTNGREITLYRIESGETCILSSQCLARDIQFPANAVADVDTLYLPVPHSSFQKLVDGAPSWRRLILSQFQARLIDMLELVNEVAFRHVDQRLARFLSTAQHEGSISSTHQELADRLGTSREVVTRILRDFEDSGILHTKRGLIEIYNLTALESRAESE